MAWFLQFSIECGADETCADAVCEFFNDEQIAIPDGRASQLNAFVLRDSERNFWCIVSPRGTHYGTGDKIFGDEAIERIVRQIYEHLKNAPPFRYAISGYESEMFRTESELKQEVTGQNIADWHGLVVQDELLVITSDASSFVPFTPGYRWQPIDRINYLAWG